MPLEVRSKNIMLAIDKHLPKVRASILVRGRLIRA
jgi:hypothetical protein